MKHEAPKTVTYCYDTQTCEIRETDNFLSINLHDTNKKYWINIYTKYNERGVQKLAEQFGFSAYLIREILQPNSNPHIEHFDTFLFFSTFVSFSNSSKTSLEYHDTSFVLGKNYVISFQDTSLNVFEELRAQLVANTNKLRERSIDYLFYRLLDSTLIRNYTALEFFNENFKKIEEKIARNNAKVPYDIQKVKTNIYNIQRKVLSLETVMYSISNDDSVYVMEENEKYFQQLQHRVVHLNDLLQNARSNASDLMNINMSEQNNRMNNVMKMLTAISAIFIPLNFIVGFFGMNFDFLPFVHHTSGVIFLAVFMVLLTMVVIYFFKKRNWF